MLVVVTKAKRRPRGAKVIAPEWRGFSERLEYAVRIRQKETGLSQNAVADAASIDSGQMTKILSGERALGVQANTVVLFAKALRVNVGWLMTGIEPSGLSPADLEPESTPAPAPLDQRKTASR